MTKEEDGLIRQGWELIAPDLASSWRLEDRLRDGRLRLIAYRHAISTMERELKIGEGVLAKLREVK